MRAKNSMVSDFLIGVYTKRLRVRWDIESAVFDDDANINKRIAACGLYAGVQQYPNARAAIADACRVEREAALLGLHADLRDALVDLADALFEYADELREKGLL